MKRLVVIIIGAVIAGKIFAAVVVKFAKDSDLTSKTLVHRLLLDRINSDDQMNVKNIPNNLAITKVKPHPIYKNHQNLPIVVNTKPLIIPSPKKKIAKTDEKAIEDKAKEDERRKNRRKALEAKTNAVADKSHPAPQFAPLPDSSPAANDNSYPTYYTYQAPLPLPTPAATGIQGTSGAGSALSKSNINSWTNLLVNNPTSSLMATFENLYKTHQITESEYYSVLDAMGGSHNSEARNFSVQASALYQNIYSFKVLADETQTESNPQIKATALTDIQVYAAAADISILQQALASGDPYEKLEAQSLLGGAGAGAGAGASVARN